MPSEPPPSFSPRTVVLFALALASLVKIAWASWSAGTCDVNFFYSFAERLQTQPIEELYRHEILFNHMPLTGWAMRGLYALAGGDFSRFAMFIRLGCVAADAAVVLALLRWRDRWPALPLWALVLFAASPVSLMVSGFHGNVDPIMTALLFFAAAAVWRDRPALSGMLFALACNVKILPLLLGPAFFLFWCSRGVRPAVRFAVAGGLVMIAGVAWPLLRCPAEFARQVLGYGSYWGTWGITYWAMRSGHAAMQNLGFYGLTAAQNGIVAALKLLIIAGAIAIGWWRRRVAGAAFFQTLALVFTVLFVFAPGVGTQYMVWGAPFLLLLSARWYAAITGTTALYVFAFYNSTANTAFPWHTVMPRGPEVAVWGPWAALPWLTFVALLSAQTWRGFGRLNPDGKDRQRWLVGSHMAR